MVRLIDIAFGQIQIVIQYVLYTTETFYTSQQQ